MKSQHRVWVCFFSVVIGWAGIAAAETEYLAIFMQGKKVGHAIQKRTVAEGKVTTVEDVNITISRIGIPVSMQTTETSIETLEGKPLAFESVQGLSGMAMKISGTIDEQGMVEVTTDSMGQRQKSTMEWPKGAVMAEGLRLLELSKGLKEGLRYKAKVFSPSIMQAVDTEVVIGKRQKVDLLGRVVTLTQTTTSVMMPGAGQIVSTSYVDDKGRALKSIMPVMGMQIELIACEKAFALGENDVLELIDKMFLASPVPLGDVASARSISYYLSPVGKADNLTIPASDNQSVVRCKDGRLIVTVKPVVMPKGARFPYRGRDRQILEALKPTRYLQSDSREIIELARRAIGRTRDAGEAAKRIEAFVAEYIENKNFSVGYASAAEVAASREGDCSEHAVLTAAMCRAVGIPAQVVTGVAYVDSFAGMRNGFGGHAWTRAYVGGKWVGLDAAFKSAGRGGYDAGHIALAIGNGNPEGFFNLATTIGQFRIDKVRVDN